MTTSDRSTTPTTTPSGGALRADEPHPTSDAASLAETARVAATVLAPTIGAGPITRRPAVMQLAERFELDRRAITTLRALRRAHHGRPVRLRLPGRSVTVLLDHADVGHLLTDAPVPFSPATLEKRAALSRFQPHGVLISEGPRRQRRRDANEHALEPGRGLHHLAGEWAGPIGTGADELPSGIGWADFSALWWRIVRQLTLGGDTAADREVTDLLGRLRQDANWAYLLPKQRRLRDRFLGLVRQQAGLDRRGSLVAALNAVAADAEPDDSGVDDTTGQVPHWLFAFDAAGIATFRALALIATHPGAHARAREEADQGDVGEVRQLPFLRACVLESLRLWPTTPALLREARADTAWGGKGTTFLAFAPLFHRDSGRLPYADRFEPDIWLDGRARAQPALVPFSSGPAACPGRDVVLFTTATLLAAILRRREVRLTGTGGARLDPGRLPASLNHVALTFSARPRP
ncbi:MULTISPECIES: cytochrome P450 [Prauserella salsuginis group]|uniref:Cytochrome P450 n=2 Tax=Prauserella salsuginis group TaxID=2893672 RepID=A0A839XVI6_9PSEU|nr:MULTISPECIES: cytochrome P450 [Prauserella salsuginis group]MBB3664016.1 cytochrome P450 [Prauserella sediminis]MCR3721471.1 Cytochrome P450 [Prauserella flava]MCR3732461.1 Cytochrome P450 [Prauserella salsuginis]